MSKTLKRQLKKMDLSEDQIPSSLDEWKQFLEIVSKSYRQYDEDRYLLERSLEVSAEEMEEEIKANKEMNSQLIQASKLSSLGTLSAGIAHELNNPLAGIKGHLHLLKKKCETKEEIHLRIKKCERLISRMSSIVNHLRTLTRDSKDQEHESINLLTPLKHSFGLLGNQLLLDNIFYEIICDLRVAPIILGDINKIESVFQNLIINSFHAFKNIESLKNKNIKIGLKVKDNDVIVTYSDNAGGMSKKVQEQLFDPFFTTKEVGVGTGLGMSITKKIMEEHNSSIDFSSTLGLGTSFQMIFPLELNEVTQPLGIKAAGLLHKKLNSRLLVVDDEADICEIYEDILAERYNVDIFSDPLKAANVLKDQKYDLLITDIKMPGLDGVKLATIARTVIPDIDLIFISGHADKEVEKSLEKFGNSFLIDKPISDYDNLIELVEGLISGDEKKAA